MVEDHYPRYFNYFEKALKSNSSQDFIVGDSITTADFTMLAFYGSFIIHPSKKDAVASTFGNYPILKAYLELRHEAQKDYFDSRPECSL